MKQVIFTILLAMILTSCSSDDTLNEMSGDLVALSVAGVSAQTKANTPITAENAQMGIFLLGANDYTAKSNVVYQYNASSSSWNATNADTQIMLSNKTATICAYYPYGSATFRDAAAPTSTTLVSQKYDPAKDLTYSTSSSTASKTSPEVSFNMNRAYAKLTFKITRDESYSKPCEISNIKIEHNDFKSSALLDIATGIYSEETKGDITYNPAISSVDVMSTVESSVLMVPVSNALNGNINLSFTVDGSTIVKTYSVSYLCMAMLQAGMNYVLPVTVSSNGISITGAEMIDSTLQPESNCYLLKPNGMINIPVSRVNSAKAVASDFTGERRFLPSLPSSWKAELLWTDQPNPLTDAGTIASITSSVANGCIQIKAGNAEGNAVVCIKNSVGKIVWSWHLWVTKTDFNVSTNQNTLGSNVFMDRNLGALTNSPATATTLGMLYQWGRKDPFPSSASVDSYVKPTLYNKDGECVFPELSGSAQDFFVASIKEPFIFFFNTDSREDWFVSYGQFQHDNLWGDKKTVFDPCPVGWILPSLNAWESLDDSNFQWDDSKKGRSYNNIYYPASVQMEDHSIGTDGYYWYAQPNPVGYDSTDAKCLHFQSGLLVKDADCHRAMGQSVRCVLEK